MTPDLDIFRSAQVLIREHGEDAALEAAKHADAMLEEGIPRDEIEAALSRVLDDIEQQIEEDKTMGRPPMGSA